MFGSGLRAEKIIQIHFFNQCRRSFFVVVFRVFFFFFSFLFLVVVIIVVTSVCADAFLAVAGDCGRRNEGALC